MLPSADIAVLSLKVNLGLPIKMRILDPGKLNPDFDYTGYDTWLADTITYNPSIVESWDYDRQVNFQFDLFFLR